MDGGGTRATVELLLHFHGFRNLDLRNRGVFGVEVVVFPVSHPSSPGVPVRTFRDPSARRSTARGILVNPVEGDVDQPGSSGISAAGLPSYTTSLLPIRYTNEEVQLNEGCLFRVHIDADWLETDVIAIEFRLMSTPLPDSGSEAAPTEEGSTAPGPHEKKIARPEEVGKVTLHTKCASSKGGLHRYHPLVFRQPHLCVLDMTLHMALTSINHPGGPAGLAAAIAANAFPSEEIGTPAQRAVKSPARHASSPSMSTPPRSEGSRRSSSSRDLSAMRPSPMRPRFITPGRSRKSTVLKVRSASFGGGSALSRFSASPDRLTRAVATRPHRLPLSAAALETASKAIGLATALGHAPPAVDPQSGVTVCAVYQTAELLYSRHALGLRWSKGALFVAKTNAAAIAAEMTTAAEAAAAAVAAKRKSKGKSRSKRNGGKKDSGGGGGNGAEIGRGRGGVNGTASRGSGQDAAKLAEGGGLQPTRFMNPNGELEGLEKQDVVDEAMLTIEVPIPAPGEEDRELPLTNAAIKRNIEIRTVTPPRLRSLTPKAQPRSLPPSPGKVPMGNGRSKKAPTGRQQQEAEGARDGRDGRSSVQEGKGGVDDGGKPDEVVAWTWGGGKLSKDDAMSKTPLPSDLRQLSRVIHTRLSEESSACSKAWSSFAKSTFVSGRRNLIALREEWVRDTTRAWSGQCLEIMPQSGADLERLNQALLDPDGFLQLRARAGIRLKRRALPTGGGGGPDGGGVGGNSSRRRHNRNERAAAGASGVDRNVPNGIARLRTMSSSGAWSDAQVFGKGNSTVSATGDGAAEAHDDDDDDHPPLLEALMPKVENQQQQQHHLGAAASATAMGSSVVTPKDQPTTSAWGTVSPWMNWSTPQRAEHGWLSRMAAGGGGGVVSSPLGSSSTFSFSGASAEGSSPQPGMVMHFPPPPQSLLPVFDRELHGFVPAAREDERWAELPFVVVESWGGMGEELPPEATPLSPMLGGDEYRLFQGIASNSLHRKKPSVLPIIKAGNSSTNGGDGHGAIGGAGGSRSKVTVAGGVGVATSDDTSAAPSENVARRQPEDAVVRANPQMVPQDGLPVLADENSDAETPPPPCYVASTPRGTRSAKPHPFFAPSKTVGVPASPGSSVASSMWSTGGEKQGDESRGSAAEQKSIWDQPENPTRHRGPKYYTARRRPPSRAPSLPSNGSSSAAGGDGHDRGGVGTSGAASSGGGGGIVDTSGYYSAGCSSSDDVKSVGGGRRGGKGGNDRKRTRRDEIQRRMWGRRPSWTRALVEPSAPAATAAAAAASVPGATAREGIGAAAAPRTESGLNHLIVLVHGLGGRPADMALMRSYLQTLMPGAELMVATSLQDVRRDNLGVEAMGKNLAEEVHHHVTRFCSFLGNAFVPVPTGAAPAKNPGSVPLSPVTPLRPHRRGNSISSVSTHAPPGSAAVARAISDELRVGSSTPTRPSKGRASGGGGGGASPSKGMLSFVCFSLGGLVARSALLEPAMVPYLTSMQCFITLACPHLGQTSTPLSFFKTGAWAVRKLTGLQVLHELDLDDADDPRETVLYRLSLSPGLERFRTIVFAANPRDGFVPLHSASVRPPPASDADSSEGGTSSVSGEMARMLMSKVNERTSRVVRMTVDAPRGRQPQGALDTVIGRAGHMCFIDSPQVAWLLSLALLPFLEENIDRPRFESWSSSSSYCRNR